MTDEPTSCRQFTLAEAEALQFFLENAPDRFRSICVKLSVSDKEIIAKVNEFIEAQRDWDARLKR
jgi:hypothetical protein